MSGFADCLDRRRTGVLLHPTSLPGPGDLGPQAYHFIEFLLNAGASVWQVLPLVPTHEDGSPYMGLSVMMGNPKLISLELLQHWGWLSKEDLGQVSGRISEQHHRHCLRLARKGFGLMATDKESQSYKDFVQTHGEVLHDFALFNVIRQSQGTAPWNHWPQEYRDRDPQSLKEFAIAEDEALHQVYFEQFVFFKQWLALKKYANDRGVLLFGDMPIFVAHDSAEVWAKQYYFDLKENGEARTVAGVPPDYFSQTGQRWGNPHYAWKIMKQDGFAWWHERIASGLELYDLIRVDHFRGFEAYWQIKANAETAIDGKWVKAPGKALFNSLFKSFESLPLVAEDLGTIDDAVIQLRDKFGFPGMRILQFAFDGDPANPYLPHNHTSNSVVYTGTHDNDTTLGWYQHLDENLRHRIYEYLGYKQEPMPWALIRAACASPASLAVLPMQDLLGLDSHHRMNQPGISGGNWQWQFQWDQVPADLPAQLRRLNTMYGRNAFD